jgi:uncharacterized iron-regulated protein
MKNKQWMVLWVILIFLSIAMSAAEESALDLLPIGASPQRLAMATLSANKIMDTASGLETTLAELVEQNLAKDVYIIGEYHDSYACHAWQKEFIEALAKEHSRLVVGFEFFHRSDDPALELYLDGKTSEAELLQKTGWYQRGSQNFAYTRLVLEAVKKLGLKAVGLNVPRELINRVARKGFASLGADEKSLFPGVERSDPEHEFFIKSTFGAFAVQVPLWFQNVYASQKCWDTVMAESMRLALARPENSGCKGIIIAGSAHVAYGLGIPWRYLQQDKRAKVMTLVPVTIAVKKKESGEEENPMVKALAGQMQPAAFFSRGLADVVFAVAVEEKPYFVETGFSGKMNSAGFYEVDRVGKDTPAEKQGVKKGDLILALDGAPVKSLEGLRLILAQKNWSDSLSLDIRKKMEFSPADEKK